MTELKKWTACLGITAVLCLACYYLGRSHAEVKIIREKGQEIIKEKEIIKYVETKKAQVWSAPHAGRTDILMLMHDNKL